MCDIVFFVNILSYVICNILFNCFFFNFIICFFLEVVGFGEMFMMCSGVVFKDCSFIFCMNRQGIININKLSLVFSFCCKNKFIKMVEYFEYNYIFV